MSMQAVYVLDPSVKYRVSDTASVGDAHTTSPNRFKALCVFRNRYIFHGRGSTKSAAKTAAAIQVLDALAQFGIAAGQGLNDGVAYPGRSKGNLVREILDFEYPTKSPSFRCRYCSQEFIAKAFDASAVVEAERQCAKHLCELKISAIKSGVKSTAVDVEKIATDRTLGPVDVDLRDEAMTKIVMGQDSKDKPKKPTPEPERHMCGWCKMETLDSQVMSQHVLNVHRADIAESDTFKDFMKKQGTSKDATNGGNATIPSDFDSRPEEFRSAEIVDHDGQPVMVGDWARRKDGWVWERYSLIRAAVLPQSTRDVIVASVTDEDMRQVLGLVPRNIDVDQVNLLNSRLEGSLPPSIVKTILLCSEVAAQFLGRNTAYEEAVANTQS